MKNIETRGFLIFKIRFPRVKELSASVSGTLWIASMSPVIS
jgi:hypothetical protein